MLWQPDRISNKRRCPFLPYLALLSFKSCCSPISTVHAHAYQFPVTIIFPFNTYGSVKSKFFVVERILTQMLNGENEVHLGDPEPIRDFIYVTDHVEGYVKALDHRKRIGDIFNICTGKGIKI